MADMKDIIFEKIGELTEVIKKDEDVSKKFKLNPVKTVELLLGVDLPDEAIMKIVDGIKLKLGIEKTEEEKDTLGNIIEGVTNLLGKKD